MFSVCIELNHDPDFQHYIHFFLLLIFHRRVSVAAIVVFGSFDFVKVNQCSHDLSVVIILVVNIVITVIIICGLLS